MGGKTSQFEDAIRRRIRAGEFPPDAALPSERRLAVEYSVGRTLVRSVLAKLATEHLIWAEHGRGYFVHAKAPAPPLLPHNGTAITGDSQPRRLLVTALDLTDEDTASLIAFLGDRYTEAQFAAEVAGRPDLRVALEAAEESLTGLRLLFAFTISDGSAFRIAAAWNTAAQAASRWSDHPEFQADRWLRIDTTPPAN